MGVGDGEGGLVCCSPWGHKELDMTEQLNWIPKRYAFGRPNFVHNDKYRANIKCKNSANASYHKKIL